MRACLLTKEQSVTPSSLHVYMCQINYYIRYYFLNKYFYTTFLHNKDSEKVR
jgi:hypothetical protein